MPRDLRSPETRDEAAASKVELTASPDDELRSGDSKAIDQDGYNEFTIHRGLEQYGFGSFRNAQAGGKNLEDLHPYVQTLSLANLDSCVALENATFPAHERCSEEKFAYRLTTCPELSLGLFATAASDELAASTATYTYARPADSASPMRKSTLIAQVIATKCSTPTVTDESMEYPADWRSVPPSSTNQGHQEHGRTLAIHSLAALPTFKGRGLGKIVMKSYIQRMETSGIIDRIALLAHDHLVAYYEALGFHSLGRSQTKFGGGGWFDMVYEISGKNTAI
ncbi:MAG: hypothetical protein Q9222_003502 [Ikaeria aurantiellina]